MSGEKDSRPRLRHRSSGTRRASFSNPRTVSHTITQVHDVSLSGVGIETRYPLRIGEVITLKYRSSELQISVEGTVAWCNQSKSQVYSIGVSFLPGEKERNALFFLALRKYLNELGGSSAEA